jgi:TNF receptor-associated protein 1
MQASARMAFAVPVSTHSASLQLPTRSFSTDSPGSAENHEFKAETRKLLDIVARSLYTDKEVFIRELISNASDALEKFRFLSSTHQISNIVTPEKDLGIRVEVDEQNRTFTITDSGIGMSRQELIDNLGTIARSGSKKFIEDVGSSDSKIIGQFGVGFYSSFVVADKVRVSSRSADSEKDPHGYIWESDGTGTFSIIKDDSVPRGTRIEIHLKEEAVDFSKFQTVKSAAQKFSSFIDFPIEVLDVTPGKENESVSITQQEALWLKTSATEEQHIDFYRFLSGNSYGEPTYSFFFHTDAPLSIKSVFYIPEEAPDRLLAPSMIPKSGVALHSRRVLVNKHADEIIPQWLYWIKGVVDCEDMPLNISRESMQDTALLKKLSNAIVKRILRYLIDESKKDPIKFSKFYRNYSTFLKAGLLEDIRVNGGSLHKDQLMKLLRFELVKSGDKQPELISLQDYCDMIGSEQKSIYYINAPNRKAAQVSPYMDGIDAPVLLLTDDIDDFVVNSIGPFGDRTFVSVDSGDDNIARAKPANNLSENAVTQTEKDRLVDLFKNTLMTDSNKKISDVSFNPNLQSSPAVVTSQLSPHMRKMMKNIIAQSGQNARDEDLFDAMPVKLELSEVDPLIKALAEVGDESVAKVLATQIYFNAMLSAGMIEDARTVLPSITEVVRVCMNQAIEKKL